VKHNINTIINLTSKLFERAGYYGFLSIIILYAFNQGFQENAGESFRLYSVLMTSLIITQFLGAIIGDLILGNKSALILGATIQVAGLLLISTISITNFYLGLGLFVIGAGLYIPNMTAHFGKNYINRTNTIDSGYTFFYLISNIGGFFGPFIIGSIREFNEWSWRAVFITISILMAISALIPIISKTSNTHRNSRPILSFTFNSINSFKLILVILFVSLFWGIFEISSIDILSLQTKVLNFLQLKNFKVIAYSLENSLIDFIFIVPVAIIFSIFWHFFFSNQFTKISIGIFMAIISLGILFLIPITQPNYHLVIYLVSILILSISEMHILPVINSAIIKYGNPKYFAIVISLTKILAKLVHLVVGVFIVKNNETLLINLKIGIISLIVLIISWYLIRNKLFRTAN
jgi:POT family proton-dependent oligopeptide transporter